MALIRTEKEQIPERTIDKEIRECDICGKDATNLVGCHECKKDLCRQHQIDLRGIRNYKEGGFSYNLEILGGIFCKVCLIKKISQVFPS